MKKIALITGGTGGIGIATATALGKAGYSVVLNGIDEEAAKVALKTLKDASIEAEFVKFDVTNEDEVNKYVNEIGQKYGHIDALINCAGGLGGRNRFENMPTSFYRNVMALNLDSAFFMSRAAIPFLKLGTTPSIINFTSIAGWNSGGPGAGIYGTSKAAVTVLTRALAKDLAEFGIRVNAVSPGTIDTPFHAATKAANPALIETWKNNILMKRLGNPEEVASVIEFLVSDKASYITGEIVQINGGQDFL